jgi:hypothetical protein
MESIEAERGPSLEVSALFDRKWAAGIRTEVYAKNFSTRYSNVSGHEWAIKHLNVHNKFHLIGSRQFRLEDWFSFYAKVGIGFIWRIESGELDIDNARDSSWTYVNYGWSVILEPGFTVSVTKWLKFLARLQVECLTIDPYVSPVVGTIGLRTGLMVEF